MEKTVSVNGIQFKLKVTAGFQLRYRNAFYVEYANDIKKLSDDGDSSVVYKVVWTAVKTANPDTPDLQTWLDSLPFDLDFGKLFAEVADLISNGNKETTKN